MNGSADGWNPNWQEIEDQLDPQTEVTFRVQVALVARAERQASAMERIADTLDRMLAVMLADEEPEGDPTATLDDPGEHADDDDLPWEESGTNHPTL